MTKAFVEAVDSGVRLPGEIVASVVFSRPMSDIDAINWWLFLAEELRKAFPNRIKGSSGKLDYPRYLKNEHGELMGRDGKTYFGVKPNGKRGRRKGVPTSDVELDKRIAEAWAKGYGEYASLNELATAFGITKLDVVAALDRHRKR